MTRVNTVLKEAIQKEFQELKPISSCNDTEEFEDELTTEGSCSPSQSELNIVTKSSGSLRTHENSEKQVKDSKLPKKRQASFSLSLASFSSSDNNI